MNIYIRKQITVLSLFIALVISSLTSCGKDDTYTIDGLELFETTVELTPESGAVNNIEGTCSGSWYLEVAAEDQNSWLSFSHTEGDYIINVKLTAELNPITESRSIDITLVADGQSIPLTIIQEGSSPKVTLSTNSISVGDVGKAVSVTVTSTVVAWAVQEGYPDWIEITDGEGSADGAFIITVLANELMEEREYTLVVGDDDATAMVTVAQDAMGTPSIDIESEFETFARTATDSQSINILTSSEHWIARKVDEADDWYTLVYSTIDNKLLVKPNSKNEFIIRKSEIVLEVLSVDDGSVLASKSLMVTQLGITVEISILREGLSFVDQEYEIAGDAAAYADIVSVSSNAPWSVNVIYADSDTDKSWMTVTPMESDSETYETPLALSIDVTKGLDTEDRSVEIEILSLDGTTTESFKVTQMGSEIAIRVSEESVWVDATGLMFDPSSITVRSSSPWTATLPDTDTWLRLTTYTGVGDSVDGEALTYEADPSISTIATRSTTITVKMDGSSREDDMKSIVVTQDPGTLTNVDAITIMAALEEMGGDCSILSGWGELDFTAWEGVTFDGDGNVTALELPNKSLTGSIPTSITSLTHLEKLDLSYNELSGAFPTSFGANAKTSLTYFDVSNNDLTGCPPQAMAFFENMEYFAVAENKLSGTLHADFANHNHYFDWDATTNVYPQQDDSEDTRTKYLANLQLKLSQLGVARVFYWALDGDNWVCSNASATYYKDGAPYIDYDYNEGSGDFPTGTTNEDLYGIAITSGKIRFFGGNTATTGTGNKLTNMSGEFPLEMAMAATSTTLYGVYMNNTGAGGKLPVAVIEYVLTVALTACNTEMDIADLVGNIASKSGTGLITTLTCTQTGGAGLMYGELTSDLQNRLIEKYNSSAPTNNLKLFGNKNLTGELTPEFITYLKGQGFTEDNIYNFILLNTGMTVSPDADYALDDVVDDGTVDE